MAAKAVNTQLVDADTNEYVVLRQLLQGRPELSEARIALVWRRGWSEDKDGRLKLGMCKKASDLDRQMHDHDFCILLNADIWPELSAMQQEAIIFHELQHCGVVMEDDGSLKRDEEGRVVYRVRGHDLEEFISCVRKYGCYKRDIEEFAAVCAKAKRADGEIPPEPADLFDNSEVGQHQAD